jgi:hypothetical protein
MQHRQNSAALVGDLLLSDSDVLVTEPVPSTGSHLPNYAARCKMGGKTPLTLQKAS